jgi:hypothetical protein
MKKHCHILILFFLFLAGKSYSQSFQISPPKLEFKDKQLLITYDFLNKKQSDQFYVWVEMEKKNGESIQPKGLSGDVGANIKSGSNKQIIWTPEKDGVYLNEEVFVELKAEKYVKSFNRGSAMLMSTVVPGLGQTKISHGKPWWVTSVVAYGAVGSGLYFHSTYLKTYDSYLAEEDPAKRSDLYDQSQQQMNVSNALIISGAAIWVANIFWVALIPNKYQPLKYVNLSLDPSNGPYPGTMLLSMRLKF